MSIRTTINGSGKSCKATVWETGQEAKIFHGDTAEAQAEAYAAERDAAAPARGASVEPTNARMTLQGTILTVVMDLSYRGGMSSTGKTLQVASTHGNRRFDVGGKPVYVGVNAYAKP